MVISLHKTILIAFSALCLNVSAGEFFYTVKRGDTLSDILFDLNFVHVYGKFGELKKTLKYNYFISKRRGHKIFPGEKIKLTLVNEEKKIELAEQTSPLPEKFETRIVETPREPLVIVDSSKNTRSITQVSEPEQAPFQEQPQEQYIFVRFAPQVSWMKVLSTSSTPYQSSNISALSKASPGILGNFGVNVSDKFNVQAFAYLSQVNFYANENPNVQLSNKSFFRQAYGLGTEYKFSSDNRMSLRVGFFDEFFLTMNTTTTVDVEKAQIPELHWGLRHIISRYKNVTLDSGIFGKFIVPYSSGMIDGNLGYGIGGDFLLLLKNKGLRLFYNYSDAKATNKSTRTLEVGWNLIFEGRFYE